MQTRKDLSSVACITQSLLFIQAYKAYLLHLKV